MPPDSESVCAQGASSSFQAWVELRKGASHHANDDGRIVKNVRHQNRSQRAHERNRRRLQRKHVHQSQVDPAARTEQGVEPGCYHHRRQQERDSGQRAQQSLAGKIKAGEQVGSGKPQNQGKQGGKGCLIKCKP